MTVNGTIAEISWCKDDAKNALDLREIPLTDENIDILFDNMDIFEERIMDAMCEAGWSVINDILEDLIEIGEIKDPYAEED